MERISFMTANYVARQVEFQMTEGWDQGAKATNDYYRPVGTYAERLGELLAKVRAMGFGALDLWRAHLNLSWATPEHIAIAARLLRENNLRVASLAGVFGSTLQEFEAACRMAAGVGAPILGGDTEVLATDRAAVVELLKKYNLKLAIENHLQKNAAEMLKKIGDGAGGAIGTAVDTGWYATQGCDPVQAIKELGRHILLVHLKDVLAPGAHESCRYGSGCVPVGACVRALQALGYDGYYSVEHEPAHSDPTDDCKIGLGMLRHWLQGPRSSTAGGRRVGVGIIGCGNIAAPYAQHLLACPQIELVGVTDQVPERAEGCAAKFACKYYPSLSALLGDPAVELVINLTIHRAHKEVITSCLEAGKHVYSEKPLALRYQEARDLVGLAQRKGVRLGCAPFTYMGEAQQTAWKIIREGRLGNVRLVYAGACWGIIESWHPDPASYFKVGVLFDMGAYPLSYLTAIFGPARRVVAYGRTLLPERRTKDGATLHIDTPDIVVAMVELGSETVVRLTMSCYARTLEQDFVEFHGNRGSLYLSDVCDFRANVEFAEPRKPYTPVDLVKQPADFFVDWGRAVSEMAESIIQGRPHRATGEHGAHVVEILCAIDEAMRSHEPVAVTSSFAPPAPMDWAV